MRVKLIIVIFLILTGLISFIPVTSSPDQTRTLVFSQPGDFISLHPLSINDNCYDRYIQDPIYLKLFQVKSD